MEIDETPVNITGEEQAVLDDEPVVSSGVGAALELAKKKGYIEDEEKKLAGARRSKAKEELEVQNYSIEDKRYDDLDEKYSRKRDRYSGGGGMIQDFKEKDGYKPDVKLEYVDDSGRMLNRKEAFRQLSHRFHGKGSGKKKTEKRSKKQQEEQLMKQMSSTDTPLGTQCLQGRVSAFACSSRLRWDSNPSSTRSLMETQCPTPVNPTTSGTGWVTRMS